MTSEISLWRAALSQTRKDLAQAWNEHRNPSLLLQQHCVAVDEAIQKIWAAHHFDNQAALLAVGGYGRGELFPHSDIDILVLLPDSAATMLQEQIGQLIPLFWDIGLDVGHSVRTVSECLAEAQNDITIETTLLETRLLCGNQDLYQHLVNELERHRDPVAFFEAKVLEQQQRHAKAFGVTNNLEPNIKENVGGLRDLHTLIWVAKAIGLNSEWQTMVEQDILTRSEARLLKNAQQRLQTLRIDLHLTAHRREDRLIFDLQQKVAYQWGLTDSKELRASEKLMEQYYRAARIIHQLNGILLPNLRNRLFSQAKQNVVILNDRFKSVNGMLALRRLDYFDKHPSAILETFLLLSQHPELNGIAPRTLRALWHARGLINDRFRRDQTNRDLFIQLFTQPQGLTRTLRRMNLYGVLGRYLPAFGKIVGRMQHDLFHVYTVDEHILMVVRNLRRFAIPAFNHEYPTLSRLIADFQKPELLYLAGLFHDIAKGRGGDHSELGKSDAREFCLNHGFNEEETELVEWLVQEHLTFSSIAQKQDIYDPAVIADFAHRVQTPRRLTALYLLTVADIRGTSPKVWNAWKAKLLEDLYHSTLRYLGSGKQLDLDSALEERKHEARILLRLNMVPDGAEEALWQQLDMVYFLRHEAREIAWHARVLNRFARSEQPLVRARLSDDREGIDVLVYTPDKPDLFARICLFFNKTAYSIADAKIYTTRHKYALDTFHVFVPENGGDISYREMINFIEFELTHAIERGGDLLCPPSQGRINRHLKHFPINPQVNIRADDKGDGYVLSIVAGDKPGLLARVACVLSSYKVSVHSAKIMTLGGRAEDAFLLTGAALNDAKSLLMMQAELLDVLRI